jgi:hypothetical protein
MKNNSNIPIEFKVSLDSSNDELRKESELKRFLNANDTKYKPVIGIYIFTYFQPWNFL